ncbi:MAG TPA: type II secretion system secretin GspD [Geminicoccus sp.]|jgi:general secretion pathway protein D|uniref:type II secretion system secretin GspD n=1 Tax=Geminicoccus sp. TaxID=2024832 RepID=UPI002E329181|nr:type II secretion system secretin GspD [Geminicoccus sp.]HEX2528718.1 type II secretion system secretin GspD [Geminicoccus sp.]
MMLFKATSPAGRAFAKNLMHIGFVALLAGCAQSGVGQPSITDGIRDLDFEPPPEPAQLFDPSTGVPVRDGSGTPGARIYTSGQTSARNARQGAVVTEDGAGVQLNFENADLREVVRTILGDVLQVNYTLDPAVNGTVTLSTSAAMSRNDLLATLETVLRQNEAALVQEAGGYAVVQMRNAIGRAGVAQLGDSPQRIEPGYGVTVIPLQHVPAITAQEFARPLIANPDDLRIDMQRNLLLVSGTAQERQTVVDTIADVDVDWLAGRSVGIFPLQATTPEAVIPELEAIFGVRGAAAAQDFTAYEGMRFIPMQRLNAVLVVSSDLEGVQRAREWVERLDAGNSVGTQLNIYQLRYTPAAAMAATLAAVIADGGGALAGVAPPTAAPAAAVDGAQLADTGQVPPDVGLAQAAQLDFGGGGGASLGNGDALRQVKIVPNEINNTLVIRATPDLYRMIEATARRLDTPPGQVVIDATIAEVTLNDRLRYGVQYFFDSGDFTFGFLNGARGANGADPISNGFPGFSFLFNSGNNQIIALDALSSVTDVRVMSAPTLVVQDNREATLNVGNEVPITVRSATADDDTARTVNTIQYRETGVILTVKPRIGGNSTVTLEISQEVSSVVQSETEDSLTPTINQRKVQSVVSVRSGQTVVLGGLIQDSEGRQRSGIPLLSDIPAIGDLFANNNRTGLRTELLVFITPRVIRNAEDAGAIGREIRDRMRGITGGFNSTPIVPGPVERGTIRGLGGPGASLAPAVSDTAAQG